jgi:hypothetical protein
MACPVDGFTVDRLTLVITLDIPIYSISELPPKSSEGKCNLKGNVQHPPILEIFDKYVGELSGSQSLVVLESWTVFVIIVAITLGCTLSLKVIAKALNRVVISTVLSLFKFTLVCCFDMFFEEI